MNLRSASKCLALLVVSVALSVGAFNAKSIALYFMANRETVPALALVLTILAAAVFGIAFLIALNPLSQTDHRDARSRNTRMIVPEQALGARPRSGSFFRPFLEDIARTARRWKLGLPRFWTGRARRNGSAGLHH